MARILVAEDEESVLRFVTIALEAQGHAVIAANDGGLAAEILDEQGTSFDLLLSDIKMPVMDGVALALHAAARVPDLKIVLMTGFADQRERAHGLDALIYDVISKPFTLTDLVEKVADALAGRPVPPPALGSRLKDLS